MKKRTIFGRADSDPRVLTCEHHHRKVLIGVVLLALTVRFLLLFHIVTANPTRFFQDLDVVEAKICQSELPYLNHFGYEVSSIAHAWVHGGKIFESPFGGSTGPTAWIAPGMVLPYAFSFALWGCFTPTSIFFINGIALAISALLVIIVYRLGFLIADSPSVGMLAAFLFAILPYEAWIFHVHSQRDFNFIVLWFALLLHAVLCTIKDPNRSGIRFGVVSCFAAIFHPGFLLCAGAGLVLALPTRSALQKFRLGFTLAVIHILLLGPYVAWQSGRLGGFVPLRSNAEFELFLGNSEASRGVLTGDLLDKLHPNGNPDEYSRYRKLGEYRFVREAGNRFRQSFDTQAFLKNTVRRCHQFFVGYTAKPWDVSALTVITKRVFWITFGLSLVGLVVVRRCRPKRLEVAALVFTLAYAFPYLITGIMERYRIPISPVVAVSLAILVSEVWRILEAQGFRRRPRKMEVDGRHEKASVPKNALVGLNSVPCPQFRSCRSPYDRLGEEPRRF